MAEIVSSLHTKFYEDSNRDKGKIIPSRMDCGIGNASLKLPISAISHFFNHANFVCYVHVIKDV